MQRLLPVVVAVAAIGVGWWAATPSPTPVDPPPAGPPAPVSVAPLLDDSALVIGVTVDGKHRAYPLADLLLPHKHVLNDTVGPAPVTVTFCDLDRCVRVFTAARRDGVPLDVTIAGPNPNRARSMLVSVNGTKYEQDTGRQAGGGEGVFPYPTLPHTLTTWGEWRTAHPGSELLTDDEVRTAK